MPLRNSIHSCLLADSRVTDLIGTAEGCRHYPERAPQGASMPYVVSQEIGGDPIESQGVTGDREDNLDETDFQFTCIASTVDDAVALRRALRAALVEDVSGVLAAAHVVVTDPRTRFSTEDDVNAHGAQLDITFFHNPNT